MIWIAVWLGVSSYCGYLDHKAPSYRNRSFFKGFFEALAMSFIPILLASLIASIFVTPPSVPYAKAETTELTAVTDNRELQGVFVLGTGGVGSSSHYRYYYEGEHGITYDVMEPSQMSQRRVFFNLQESSDPRLEVYQPTQRFSLTPWAIHWHRLSKWKFSIPESGYKVVTEIDGR